MPKTLATFRLQYEDDYEFTVLSTRFRFGLRKFSNLKLELVVVLVLQSEGRYCYPKDNTVTFMRIS